MSNNDPVRGFELPEWNNSGPVERTEILQVEVSPGILDEICESLVTLAAYQSSTPVDLKVHELQAFSACLVISRVGYVRAQCGYVDVQRVKQIAPKYVEYPAVFFPILSSVGLVHDTDLGVKFIPNVSKTIADLEKQYGLKLDDEFFKKVGQCLHILEQLGLQLGRALPVSRDGSYGFIMCLKAEEVRSPSNKGSRADAVIASIIKNATLEQAVRYPFSYGSVAQFYNVASALASRAYMRSA
jgi:hypothetical protein